MKKSKKVLVVEDEKAIREAYNDILQMAGHEVSLASSGLEALDVLALSQPDVMLLDLYMPNMTGSEMLQKLQKDRYSTMKIVALSNVADIPMKAQVLEWGVDSFVTKADLSPKQLIQLVENL